MAWPFFPVQVWWSQWWPVCKRSRKEGWEGSQTGLIWSRKEAEFSGMAAELQSDGGWRNGFLGRWRQALHRQGRTGNTVSSGMRQPPARPEEVSCPWMNTGKEAGWRWLRPFRGSWAGPCWRVLCSTGSSNRWVRWPGAFFQQPECSAGGKAFSGWW